MNRKFSAVIFLFLLPQTTPASEIKAMFGINSSKYLFSSPIDSLNRQQKTGFEFGLGLAFGLSKNTKLEINALYRQGGAKASIAYTPDMSLAGFYRNTSFALPIIFKYQFKIKATPYIGLGPEPVFLLSHHFFISDSEDAYNLRDHTKRFILAVTALVGYELPLGKWNLSVEIRYSHWLSNFLLDPETEARSESFALLIGGIYYL